MEYREEVRDLFAVPDDYYLAHCISADFALGAGVALEFNKRFGMQNTLRCRYPRYLVDFNAKRLGGDCILEGRVLNLVTKERYYEKPSIITLMLALQKMNEVCAKEGIRKIAMPTIGTGFDHLQWRSVVKQIKAVFADTDVEILVCKLR